MTFGTHNCLRPVVEETPGVAFLSAGRMPMHDHHLRVKVRQTVRFGSARLLFSLPRETRLGSLWLYALCVLLYRVCIFITNERY